MRKYNTYKSYGVDSKWELHLRETVFKKLKYHPLKLHYTKPETEHTYEPDWIIDEAKTIYIEAKGRFRDRAEYTKYIHIRESLDSNWEELVFLFMKPMCPMPGAKKRKDGTIRTHSEWAEKQGFRWFSEKNVHLLLGED